ATGAIPHTSGASYNSSTEPYGTSTSIPPTRSRLPAGKSPTRQFRETAEAARVLVRRRFRSARPPLVHHVPELQDKESFEYKILEVFFRARLLLLADAFPENIYAKACKAASTSGIVKLLIEELDKLEGNQVEAVSLRSTLNDPGVKAIMLFPGEGDVSILKQCIDEARAIFDKLPKSPQ
ncbi:MAG: hypothetical protein AAF621_05955, partial [Pseudomonadota bacterium]